tara:strand:+ start:29293 stop:30297 length:1005 start_codon:yes stop_codon:yes gene_type:complete
MFKKDDVKLIAEIGGNHEGDFGYALELLQLAIESEVDSIKFQIYSGSTLVNEKVDKDRKEHFDKFTFSSDQYKEIALICLNHGVDFSASIWNEPQLQEFDDYLSFYKIGSGDLTAFPIIESHCKRGKPIILSTGLSTLKEVQETVNFICECNPIYLDETMLCIMQCTSSYPTPDKELNLEVIKAYKENFKYSIGFSSHSTNPYALDYSVALGARVLEFHFTDTREGKEFRDHKVSLTKTDVLDLKKRIPFLIDSLGNSTKQPTESEVESDHINSFRRAVYPKNHIPHGKKVSIEDFVFLRPQEGLSPNRIHSILGKKSLRDLKPLEPILEEDFG